MQKNFTYKIKCFLCLKSGYAVVWGCGFVGLGFLGVLLVWFLGFFPLKGREALGFLKKEAVAD